MALNDILDRKIENFIENKLSEFYIIVYCSSLEPKPYKLIENIDQFISGFNRPDQLEYVLLKLVNYLEKVELTEKNTNAHTSYKPESVNRFLKNRTLVIDHILLELGLLDHNFDIEMFSNDEYEDLLSKIDKIAESLFAFQQKSDIANEIIYDSIYEIKEELKAQAEKGKIFGKEFVEQQLAGKIMDMAFKGSFFAMLSHAPEQISDIAGHVKGLL